jgi:hypothetical protein
MRIRKHQSQRLAWQIWIDTTSLPPWLLPLDKKATSRTMSPLSRPTRNAPRVRLVVPNELKGSSPQVTSLREAGLALAASARRLSKRKDWDQLLGLLTESRNGRAQGGVTAQEWIKDAVGAAKFDAVVGSKSLRGKKNAEGIAIYMIARAAHQIALASKLVVDRQITSPRQRQTGTRRAGGEVVKSFVKQRIDETPVKPAKTRAGLLGEYVIPSVIDFRRTRFGDRHIRAAAELLHSASPPSARDLLRTAIGEVGIIDVPDSRAFRGLTQCMPVTGGGWSHAVLDTPLDKATRLAAGIALLLADASSAGNFSRSAGLSDEDRALVTKLVVGTLEQATPRSRESLGL